MMMYHRIKLQTFKNLSTALLVVWMYAIYVFISNGAYVPDEAYFLHHAIGSYEQAVSGDGIGKILFAENAYGYGGIYWTVYIVATMLWGDIFYIPMFIMRYISIVAMFAFGAQLIQSTRSIGAALLCAFLFVTSPIAWWSGKVASPELIAAALFVIATICWFVHKKPVAALVLATVSAGLKLTVAPLGMVLVAFVIFDVIRHGDRPYMKIGKYALMCAGVFIACNAWLLHSPIDGVTNLVSMSNVIPPFDLADQSKFILLGNTKTWDGTNYGSLLYWSGGIFIIATSIISAFMWSRHYAAFLVVSFVTMYVFMLSRTPHPWYWFPFILAMIVPFSRLNGKSACIVLTAIILTTWPFDYLRNELQSRIDQEIRIDHGESIIYQR